MVQHALSLNHSIPYTYLRASYWQEVATTFENETDAYEWIGAAGNNDGSAMAM